MEQNEYISNPKPINLRKSTKKEFSYVRGQLGYIVNSIRPDIAYNYAEITQVKANKAYERCVKSLNSILNTAQYRPLCIVLPKLDFESIIIEGYVDAGFIFRSLFFILIINGNHPDVQEQKCVSDSLCVFAAQIYALSTCEDYCQIISHDLKLVTGEKILHRFKMHIGDDRKVIFNF